MIKFIDPIRFCGGILNSHYAVFLCVASNADYLCARFEAKTSHGLDGRVNSKITGSVQYNFLVALTNHDHFLVPDPSNEINKFFTDLYSSSKRIRGAPVVWNPRCLCDNITQESGTTIWIKTSQAQVGRSNSGSSYVTYHSHARTLGCFAFFWGTLEEKRDCSQSVGIQVKLPVNCCQ